MKTGIFKKAAASALAAAALFTGSPARAQENPVFSGRHIVAEQVRKYCFSPAHGNDNDSYGALRLRDIFNSAGEKSPTGRLLQGGAVRRDIAYCDYGDQGHGTGAVYRDYLGMVQMDLGAGDLYNSTVISHETLHGIQGGNALLKTTWNQSLDAILRSSLYQEAAGDVIEVIVAYEARLNRDSKTWNYLSTPEPGHPSDQSAAALAYKKAFDAMRAQGLPPTEATERAGSAAFEEKMKSREWRAFYITRTTMYLGGLYDIGYFGLADAQKPLGHDIAPGVMVAAGEITAEFSLTRHAREPTREQIFEGLPGLRHAFEALELARMQKAYGPGDARVVDTRHYQEVLGNPYLDIDWGAVKKLYDAEKKFVPLNENMDNVKSGGKQKAVQTLGARISPENGPGLK